MLQTILLIFSFIIVYTIAIKGNIAFKKNADKFYIISLLLCLFTILVMFKFISLPHHAWYMLPISLLSGGFMGVAIWTTVMLARHIPNTKLKAKLMAVRSELSIMGFFLTLPQPLVYTTNGWLKVSSQPTSFIYPMITSIYLILLLVLGITSFPQIRKKLSAIRWKKIQKWAYLFYYLLFIQLICIAGMRTFFYYSMGNTTETFATLIRTSIYLFVFVLWHILKRESKKG